jgi:iron transport multicopper oxidase
MQVPKSLIAKADGTSQVLRLTAYVHIAQGYADLVFSTGEGAEKVDHATCHVTFGTGAKYLSEWSRNAYLVQSRIEWLQDAEKQGKAHKIGRGLAYKLFAALVDYDKKYRGMEEVILRSETMEATAKVNFQTTEKDGNFMYSPYWIDSLAHISGFIVNGSDAVNSQESVYISHGWETMQFAEPISADKTYRSYVKMQPQPGGKIMAGDVWIFDGDRIVAAVGGLKFQCIPRKVLNMMMPIAGAVSSRPTPVRQPVAESKKIPATKKSTPQVTMASIQTVNQKLASVTSRALDILVAEIGVGIEELVDNVAFSDLGCDSLMSLTVSGRIREELEIDINSHDFQNYATVGEFTKFLSKFESQSPIPFTAGPSSSASESPLNDFSTDEEGDSTATTPVDDSASECDKGSEITEIIRITIADEMGCDVDEIFDDADLASLGMDSLMSLTVLGAIREKTGLNMAADLLTVNKSIREIEQALNPKPVATKTTTSRKSSVQFDTSSSRKSSLQSETSVVKVETSVQVEKGIVKPTRAATSVLLQGNSRLATKHLWMVPDGGGSATSYVEIPDLSSDVAVWGLNSPYMKCPEEYNIGVVGMAERFITEMKRRQPVGPYLLAGWSAGGVIAFEAVNQLTKANEQVEQLILIDSPCPDIIEPLPSSLHRWFGSIGLLGDGDLSKLPPWLLPHFAASVNALSNYTAEKVDPAKCPLVTTIWCEDGVCKLPTDPRPDPFPYGHAQFLLDNRTDFGPNLWDRYLNSEKMSCHHMPGNHVSCSQMARLRNMADNSHSLR